MQFESSSLKRLLTALLILISSVLAIAESGEAKISSRESMQKVKNGNPILEENRQRHLQKAAMYQAQMNFPMAANEMAKAQMLQQQIQQNDQSRQKNSDRQDTSIEASDPTQSQLSMASLPGASKSALAGSASGKSRETNNGAAPTENLVFNETVKSAAAQSTTGSAGTTATTAEISNKISQIYDSSSDVADLTRSPIAIPVPPPQYIAASESAATEVTPTELDMTRVDTPEVKFENAPLAIVAPIKKDDKEKKEKDAFWKEKKSKKKVADRRKKKGSRRAVASKKSGLRVQRNR